MYGVIRCNLLPIFCQVKTNDGVTKWLASEGLVGQMLRGRLGHVAG